MKRRLINWLGLSGVGKSSFINCLLGENHLETNGLIRLPEGGMVIDTPGIRELGMWDEEDDKNDKDTGNR